MPPKKDRTRESVSRWMRQAARAAADKRGTFTIEQIANDAMEQLDVENNPVIKDELARRGAELMFELAKKRDPAKFRELELAMMYRNTNRPEGSPENIRALVRELEELARQQEEEEDVDAG